MRKINMLLMSLTFSLVILLGMASEQNAKANLPGGEASCMDLASPCNRAPYSCAGKGTISYCSITCEGGGTIICGSN